jgi:hypothetical protein
MSNTFKQNSRFAALADEIKESKKDNNMKNQNAKNQISERSSEGNIFKRNPEFYDRPKRIYDNRNSKEQNERRLKEEQIRKEKEEKEREENIKKALNPASFPDLISTPIEKQEAHSMNFLNKLTSEEKVSNVKKSKENIDLDYENLKPGWAIAKKDPNTGKIITKHKETLAPKPREKTEQEIGVDIINALVKLYEKRKNEYINMWGYDTWERMYRFPNYDYEYFNKLDELYEEMENQESEYEISDNDNY